MFFYVYLTVVGALRIAPWLGCLSVSLTQCRKAVKDQKLPVSRVHDAADLRLKGQGSRSFLTDICNLKNTVDRLSCRPSGHISFCLQLICNHCTTVCCSCRLVKDQFAVQRQSYFVGSTLYTDSSKSFAAVLLCYKGRCKSTTSTSL